MGSQKGNITEKKKNRERTKTDCQLIRVCMGLFAWTKIQFIYLIFPGEGNGSPLQYSCLENPRDGGAWWAAVYGVTQSRT